MWPCCSGCTDRPAEQRAVGVLDLALLLAHLGIEVVAQDGEQPGAQVGALLEGIEVGPRLDQRLLHQVVGDIDIAGQRQREGPEARDRRQQIVAQGG
jgi:hypothetical protein